MFDYTRVPKELKEQKRWVLWKLKVTEKGRTTKVPINAMTGYGAKSNDPDTWCEFDYAINQIDKYSCNGLGFMLGSGFFGVDIDHQINNNELINEFVNTLDSYTELSQSGDGIHIISKGTLPVGNRRKGNIEMYDNARFFAMTGQIIDDHVELKDNTNKIIPLWEKYLNAHDEKPTGGFTYESIYERPQNMVSVSLTDEQVLQKAKNSKNGTLFQLLYSGQWEGLRYASQSDADEGLCIMLAFWTGKDHNQMDRLFQNSGLMRNKWLEKRGERTYGEITITNAINRCANVYQVPDNSPNIIIDRETGVVKLKNTQYELNDTGNAQRFVDRFGIDLRYNFDNKCWVIWNGKTWLRDVTQIVKAKADVLIEEMRKETFDEQDEKKQAEMLKNIKHLSSNSGKEAMLKEAMHIDPIPTRNSDYNKDIYLLNCENGIVDLKTGKVMPHDRKYMMSKNTNIPCDMSQEPMTWKKCLNDIFLNDKDLVDFVQKAVGYSLTGDTKEQCFFQCYGNGSNGKSVFLNTMYGIFGDYILNAQVESILTRGKNTSGGASSDIARMDGARFVRTNEPSEGSRFNEGLVKQLTGGDIVTARFLYGGEFEFAPVFKLWIASNYPIIVRGTDKGIWRRMRLIPFEAVFEGINDDKDIELKLKKELPYILGWAIKGCIEWQKVGLGMPLKVKQATSEYKEEMDIVESFCKECVLKKPSGKEKASDVFNAYRIWARNGNEYVMTQSKFGKEMGKRYMKKNIHGYVYYLGFILKENDQSFVYE